MNCPKCNFQNEESAKFCMNCGTKFSIENVEEQNKQSKLKRNGYGIAGLVFAIISIFAISAEKDDAPPPIAIIFFSLLGISFSCIGFFQKDKKNTTAIIGLVFSIVVLITFIIGLSCNLEF